jgi:hypothetical protein
VAADPISPRGHRANAFARLFEAVHEGVFIGSLATASNDPRGFTVAANPHLKQIFGYSTDTPEHEVEPFAPARFAEASARRRSSIA